MKYSCNMIRDIMPLCADKEASAESEKALIEHLAECEACGGYWEKMSSDLSFGAEGGENVKNYTEIAKKLRVKKRIIGIAASVSIGIALTLAGNIIGIYAVDGYKFSPEKALAVPQNNIGVLSEKIGEYEREGVRFYFYKNQLYTACYGVEKSFFGWRHNVTYLSDLPEYTGAGIVNNMRGTITYENGNTEDKSALHMLPLTVYDDNAVKITLFAGGNEYSTDVYPGYTGVLAYESPEGENPVLKGYAYDKEGKVLYRLDNSDEFDLRWVEE